MDQSSQMATVRLAAFKPAQHATQLTAEAAALLEKGQRPKLPDELFESFINSVQDYARRPGGKPLSQEILDKVNQIHFLTKSSLVEDITLIKMRSITQQCDPLPESLPEPEKIRAEEMVPWSS